MSAPYLELLKTTQRPITFLDPAPYELPEQEPEAKRRNPLLKGTSFTTANEVASIVAVADRQVRIDSAKAMAEFIRAANTNASTLNRALDSLDAATTMVDDVLMQLEHQSWTGRKRRVLNVFRRLLRRDEVMPPDVSMHLPRIVLAPEPTPSGADRDQGRS